MALNRKKFLLLCSALLVSGSNFIYGRAKCRLSIAAPIQSQECLTRSRNNFSFEDFFTELFSPSSSWRTQELPLQPQKQHWADIQKEIEATTPHLHEVSYLLDQLHAKKRDNLGSALASIDNVQQHLAIVKTRLENHVASSNDFFIEEEQTADALTLHIATPGFDMNNITVTINEHEKTLTLVGNRLANGSFTYSSQEYNTLTGKESVINYENGKLVVLVALPEGIEYSSHIVAAGDDEIIGTLPFSKKNTEQTSHEHVEAEDGFTPASTIDVNEEDEESTEEEEIEEK